MDILKEIYEFLKNGKINESGQLFEKLDENSLTSENDISFFYFLKSWFFYRTGDLKSSKHYAKLTKESNLTDPLSLLRANFYLGTIARDKGNFEKAIQDFEKLLSFL